MRAIAPIIVTLAALAVAGCAPRNIAYAQDGNGGTEVTPTPAIGAEGPSVSVGFEPTSGVTGVFLQAGLFTRPQDARWRIKELRGNGLSNARSIHIQYNGQPARVVIVGPLQPGQQLDSALRTLAGLGVHAFQVRTIAGAAPAPEEQALHPARVVDQPSGA